MKTKEKNMASPKKVNAFDADTLYNVKKGNIVLVDSTPDVGLLANLGVRVGSQVKLQYRYPFGGPVLLRINDAYSVAVGKDIATQITVKKLAEEAA